MNVNRMVDIHCHLLPYVDDGAEDLDEAVELLEEQHRQGVTTICFTPHLRTGMFESPDEKIIRQFERLDRIQRENGFGMSLYLSREYHCDRALMKKMKQEKLLTMGGQNHILLEFSNAHSFSVICDRVQQTIQLGYRPLIAHIERYIAIQEDRERAEELVQLGAKLQVNAGSILGKEGLRQKWLIQWLITHGLVYAVASDAHDMQYRKPLLEQCFRYLERKYGEAQAAVLLRDNPLHLLQD